MAGSNRVLENVVRTANSIQNPAGGFHMLDQVHTFHGAYHTHDRRAASTMAPAPRRRAADRPRRRDRTRLGSIERTRAATPFLIGTGMRQPDRN